MPTYEFRCPEGHDFEKFYRTISGAESVAACPVCGKESERMMSATGFAFKGSGFYLTDYGKNAHRGEAPPSSSGNSDSGSSSGESGGSSEKSTASDGPSKKADAAPAAEAKPAPKAESAPSKKTEAKPMAAPKPKPSE